MGGLHRRVRFAHLLEPNHVFLGPQPLASGDRATGGLGCLWCPVSRAMSPCSPQDLPLLWVVARPLHCPTPVGPCALRGGEGVRSECVQHRGPELEKVGRKWAGTPERSRRKQRGSEGRGGAGGRGRSWKDQEHREEERGEEELGS